jgi:hypothetical protein
MKFFFCGGSNLTVNTTIKDENLTFPHIVSEHFGAECTNASRVGGSNKRTIRKIFCEYDMEEYDFIFIAITPFLRTEFYSEKSNKWIPITPRKKYEYKEEENIRNLFYEHIFNETFAYLTAKTEYNIITKYLNSLDKKYMTMLDMQKDYNTLFKNGTVYKNKNLNQDMITDFYVYDYPFDCTHFGEKEQQLFLKGTHLSDKGHKLLADDIIKKYENSF